MPQNPTLEERRLLTLRLRIAGWSYREIATRVGVSPAQVFRDIKRVCDQLRKEQYATASQLRTQTAMALEEKLTRWWTAGRCRPGRPRQSDQTARRAQQTLWSVRAPATGRATRSRAAGDHHTFRRSPWPGKRG